MKKKYEGLELTIELFKEDVITASIFENATKDFDSWFIE